MWPDQRVRSLSNRAMFFPWLSNFAWRLISTWRTREKYWWTSLKRLKRKNHRWLNTLAAVIAERSDLKWWLLLCYTFWTASEVITHYLYGTILSVFNPTPPAVLDFQKKSWGQLSPKFSFWSPEQVFLSPKIIFKNWWNTINLTYFT